MNKYTRFITMIVASTLVMFGLMYLNTYAMDHVFFSQTRAWVALYMGGAMAIVMLLFMLGMYDDSRKNIAVLTSTRARIEDLRVRALADGIVTAQRKEIKEVEWLIRDIAQNGKTTTPEQAQSHPVPVFEAQLDEE